jgi:anti-anti-sigma factor
MKHALRYESRLDDDRTWVWTLEGDLFGNAGGYAFQEEVRGKVGEGARRLILDLAGVHRIDSSGIGILVALMWSASHSGGGLVCAALPPRVEKFLGLAMLLDHNDHAPTIDGARAKLDTMGL